MGIIKNIFTTLATVALCIMLAASCNAIGIPILSNVGLFVMSLLMCLCLGWKLTQLDIMDEDE